jgi:hypothetical protein
MELLTLVQETLQFLSENYGIDLQKEVRDSTKSGNFSTRQLPSQKEVVQKRTPPTEKKLNPSPTKERALEEMFSSLNGSLKFTLRPATTYLVLLPEDQAFLPFLENLAQAIRDHFGSSLVVKIKNEKEWPQLLETPYLKLLLIPKSDKTVHSIEGKVLYLAPLADYQRDIELKRDLWKILKSYFLPQLSSTPGSIKP